MFESLSVKMCGEKMTLEMSGHAKKRCKERLYQMDISDVYFRIAQLVEVKSVAEACLFEVPIGEECVILDEDNNCSYVLVVERDRIVVVTVFQTEIMASGSVNRMRVAQKSFGILIRGSNLVSASLFCDLLRTANY